MSLTSKSPKAVLLTAYHTARAALPAYRHPCSPKKFTQHQLFACLVLKAMLKLDYRGLCGLLQDAPGLREAIGLRVTPHYTSFQKAAARMLGDAEAAKLLDATIISGPAPAPAAAGKPAAAPTGAIDSTGLSTSHASEYFTRRRREAGEQGARTTYRSYAKLGLACDIASHQILAMAVGVGPSPDVVDFVDLLEQAQGRRKLGLILADAGYDSEPNHAFAREELGVVTPIPASRGRPTKDGSPPTGKYRCEMSESFDGEAYGQRRQVETVMSMIKRRLGGATWSRQEAGRSRDLRLLALTHNILI